MAFVAVQEILPISCKQRVVARSAIEGIIGTTAKESIMSCLAVKSCVCITPFKRVITGSAEQSKTFFFWLELFRITCTFCCGFGGDYNDHLSGGWCWAFAASDTDGERQDLNLFFVRIVLWYE